MIQKRSRAKVKKTSISQTVLQRVTDDSSALQLLSKRCHQACTGMRKEKGKHSIREMGDSQNSICISFA